MRDGPASIFPERTHSSQYLSLGHLLSLTISFHHCGIQVTVQGKDRFSAVVAISVGHWVFKYNDVAVISQCFIVSNGMNRAMIKCVNRCVYGTIQVNCNMDGSLIFGIFHGKELRFVHSYSIFVVAANTVPIELTLCHHCLLQPLRFIFVGIICVVAVAVVRILPLLIGLAALLSSSAFVLFWRDQLRWLVLPWFGVIQNPIVQLARLWTLGEPNDGGKKLTVLGRQVPWVGVGAKRRQELRWHP
mmetsp:Transcript_15633/g.34179  ORF Transcript_15633/g.34179 Transcript_15633/m.34179 type:complete len:245 (+) Transcript_15633:172-906(+)